jgi:hypothetical protein
MSDDLARRLAAAESLLALLETQQGLLTELGRAVLRGDWGYGRMLVDALDPAHAGRWTNATPRLEGGVTPPVPPDDGPPPDPIPDPGPPLLPIPDPAPPPASRIQLGVLQNNGPGIQGALKVVHDSHLQWVRVTAVHALPLVFAALADGGPRILYSLGDRSPADAALIARRYGAQIAAWGLANEPSPRDGTVAEVLALLTDQADAVRGAVPGAVLVGPDLQAGVLATDWGQQLVRALVGQHLLDAWSVHAIAPAAGAARTVADARAALATLRACGVPPEAPVWLTEFGDPGDQRAFLAAVVPQLAAAGYAVGIVSMLVDPGADSDYHGYQLCDASGAPRDGFAALDALALAERQRAGGPC